MGAARPVHCAVTNSEIVLASEMPQGQVNQHHGVAQEVAHNGSADKDHQDIAEAPMRS
jgi:hypothetical protein